MPGNDDLEQACLELALAIKIVKEPISSYDARGLANRFLAVAEDRIYLPLDIDRPLVTRAVRYLTQVHAIPPMGDDTLWFSNILRVHDRRDVKTFEFCLGFIVVAFLDATKPETGLSGALLNFAEQLVNRLM
jgi:hypothetical protein